jgi:transcriptional regulator with XRE-family HTH domain
LLGMKKAVKRLLTSKHSQAEIARILETSPQSVHQWLKEDVRPSDDMIKRMRDRLDVPITEWFEDARKAS